MRIDEIEDSDDATWKIITGNSFYADFYKLKDNYGTISADYDQSTSRNKVMNKIYNLKNMHKKIKQMYDFCKKAHPGTDTDAFLKSLKLMHGDCKEMITDLERYL